LRWISDISEAPRGSWRGEATAWVCADAARQLGNTSYDPRDLADAAAVGMERGANRLMKRSLLRHFVARVAAIHPDQIEIERRANGDSEIVSPQGMHASDSSRNGIFAIVISALPIGIDVESRPAETPLPINLLRTEERAALKNLDPVAREEMFLRFWTAKEAYLKSAGGNLMELLRTVRACALDGEVIELRYREYPLAHVRTLVTGSFVAAVALRDA
jgi:phosphopantetheinyl transferase